MKNLNLTVIGYILPNLEDDMIIGHLDSFGKNFWENVETNIVISKKISDKLAKAFAKYGINYTDGVEEYWIPTVLSLVESCKTKYVEVLLEDKLVTDEEKFIHSLQTLDKSNLDFMPSHYTKYWNTLAEWLGKYTDIVVDDDFTIIGWGTKYSVFSRKNNFRECIEGLQGDPFPVVAGGIYKTKLLLKLLERVLASRYWNEICTHGPNYFTDWAKNPKLPHSFEVWWKHNDETEPLDYTVLVPKDIHSIANDPKNNERWHLE